MTIKRKNLITHYQKNPISWMSKVGWGFWSKQIDICKALARYNKVICVAATGVGKTYLSARIGSWFLNTHPNSNVILTAPIYRQVRDYLWAEVKDAYQTSKLDLGGTFNDNEIALYPDKKKYPKWMMKGVVAQKSGAASIHDKLTGLHSKTGDTLIIVDQAAGCPNELWDAMSGLLTGKNAKLLVITNPFGEDSEVINMWNDGGEGGRKSVLGDDFIQIPISALESPNLMLGYNKYPFLPKVEWVEEKKRIWGIEDPLFQMYILGRWVESSQLVVLTSSMTKSMFENDSVDLDYNKDIVIGLDVAHMGSDSSVWFVQNNNRLLFIDRLTGCDIISVVKKTKEVVEKACKLMQANKDNIVINVDATGAPGTAVQLRADGYNANSVYVGETTKDKEIDRQYTNQRAYYIWYLRTLAEGNSISLKPMFHVEQNYLDMLREECQVRYFFNPSNKIQIEKKDKIKSRLKRSPDFFDAMYLSMMPNANNGFMNYAKYYFSQKEKQKQLIHNPYL